MCGPIQLSLVAHGVPCGLVCEVADGRVVAVTRAWVAERRRVERASVAGATMRWRGGGQAVVLDLSVQGAGIRVDKGSQLPAVGRFEVELRVGSKRQRGVAQLRSHRGDSAGLSIAFEQRLGVAVLCHGTRLPNLRLRRQAKPAAMRRLLEDTGYLALRPGHGPSPAWLNLEADSVSRDFVYLADDQTPVGHVSVTRAYPRTWLGHQIVMRRDHTESIAARAALYDAFATWPGAAEQGPVHLLGYFDRSHPWHQLFFEHFVTSLDDAAQAVVVPWDRFERTPDAKVCHPGPHACTVEALAAEDAPELVAMAREQLPTLMADAIDLCAEGLVTTALHPAFRETGLQRARHGFSLRENGRITAFALCELTDRRLSLFNLMNLAQLFATPHASKQGQLALQNRVRVFYREHGIKDPLVVAPAGTVHGTQDPAVRLEETMGCIVWSAEGLRAYQSFLNLHFAWLADGRQVPTAFQSASEVA